MIGVKEIVIEEYSRYAKSLTIKDRVGGRTLAAFGGGGLNRKQRANDRVQEAWRQNGASTGWKKGPKRSGQGRWTAVGMEMKKKNYVCKFHNEIHYIVC